MIKGKKAYSNNQGSGSVPISFLSLKDPDPPINKQKRLRKTLSFAAS
jgi:hypothetical protein